MARAAELQRTRMYDPWLAAALSDASASVRQAAASALATIDDPAASAALVQALASSDVALVSASARGLSISFRQLGLAECGALAVALARMQTNATAQPALVPLARGLGGCDSAQAEPMLRALLLVDEPAALAGLGRLARTRNQLQHASMDALLDCASRADRPEEHAVACLEPLSHAPFTPELSARVLARSWPVAVITARVLAQLGVAARQPLEALADQDDPALTARAARFEALRVLAKMGSEAAFERVLVSLAPEPEQAPAAWAASARGAAFAQVLGLAPAVVRSPLLRSRLADIARLDASSARLDTIRCDAATRVSGSAFDSAPMLRCAPEGSQPYELARLVALDRSLLRGGRLPHFQELLQSAHVAVREAALGVLSTHPEALGAAWGLTSVVHALGSEHPGEVIAALAAANKLPASRSAALVAAFDGAATHAWPDDVAELYEALLTIGRAKRFSATEDLARTLTCHAAQPVRRLAREIVQNAPTCTALAGVFQVAPGPGATITLQSTAGALVMHLESSAAKVSVATIVRLARDGFYDHIGMHRVVPGFVVQFGDPEGDGYGGAGKLLLHETSDHSFGPLRIGLAHAGFDTASSQLFVTTGPAPRLDGEYTWIGTASGPWQDVVQGDRVTGVQIGPE